MSVSRAVATPGGGERRRGLARHPGRAAGPTRSPSWLMGEPVDASGGFWGGVDPGGGGPFEVPPGGAVVPPDGGQSCATAGGAQPGP